MLTQKKIEIIIKLGDDPAVLARTAQETLQTTRTTLGPGVIRARAIPHGRTALTLAVGQEGSILRGLL